VILGFLSTLVEKTHATAGYHCGKEGTTIKNNAVAFLKLSVTIPS